MFYTNTRSPVKENYTLNMISLVKRLRVRASRRHNRQPFYPDHDHHSGLERQIEIVDPARHLGEEYPSVDVQRRYGRT
jgi:hypothetical protein